MKLAVAQSKIQSKRVVVEDDEVVEVVVVVVEVLFHFQFY